MSNKKTMQSGLCFLQGEEATAPLCKNVNKFAEAVLAKAKQMGVEQPVVLLVPENANYISELSGELKAPTINNVFPAQSGSRARKQFVEPKSVALSILRRQGERGVLVADILERGANVHFWVVALGTDSIELGGVTGGALVAMPCDIETEEDHRPTNETIIAGGQPVDVFGDTRKAAEAAAVIVRVVVNDSITLPINGRMIPFKLIDRALAYMLEQQKNQPRVIVEVIRALRKLTGHKDRRVSRILSERPELRELAKIVNRELAAK